MIKNYPEFLERHSNPFYTLNDVSSFSQGMAYYHERFPILMHAHNYYELNVVTQGECRHYFNNKSHPAKAGDVFMIPPYAEHGYWTDDENTKLYHLIIKKDIPEEYRKQLANYAGMKILFEVEPQIRRAFNDLSLNINIPEADLTNLLTDFDELVAIDKAKYDDGGVLFDLKTVCLLCKLAMLISQNYAVKDVKDDKFANVFVLKAVRYMEENYSSKITVGDISRSVNMSVPSCFRYFRKVFNVSPMEYLKNIRISHATAMLSSTNESVSFIAQECGFFDSSHFTHVFERSTNMKPKEFRKKVQSETSKKADRKSASL